MFEVVLKIEVKEKGENFKEIENRIKTTAFKGAQDLAKLAFKEFESNWLLKHKSARNKGVELGKFKSSFGEFSFPRTKVKHKGSTYYPLDKWIGVTPYRRQTPTFKDILEDEYTDRTFRKGTKTVEKRTGVKISPYSGWESFQRIAEEKKKLNSNNSVRLKNLPLPKLSFGEENPCPVLRIEPDETYCRSQPICLKDQEIKIATLYTGKKYSGKKHKRAELLNKTVVTAYVGESVSSFVGRVAEVAIKTYGANENTVVIICGDGVGWIPRLKYDYFEKATYFLDWWHVKKKMQLAFGKPATEDMMDFIYARNPNALLRHIETEYFSGSSPKVFDAAEAFYNYIDYNKEGLEFSGIDPNFKKEHPGMFKRGSGVIERNVDLVIGERCKLKRMRWSPKGLDNMRFLRENRINKQVDSPILKMVSNF